ncbi:MAG: ion channel [Mycoplasma sp.]
MLRKIASLSEFRGWNFRKKQNFPQTIYTIVIIVTCLTSIIVTIASFNKDSSHSTMYFQDIVFLVIFSFDWIANALKNYYKNEDKKIRYLILFFPSSLFILASILPSIIGLLIAFDCIKPTRGLDGISLLRVLRLIYIMKYLELIGLFVMIFKMKLKLFLGWGVFLLIILTTFAISIYVSEPQLSFWDSMYYSIIVMSTIGLGDIAPTNTISQVLTAAFGFVGGLMYTSFGALIITSILEIGAGSFEEINKLTKGSKKFEVEDSSWEEKKHEQKDK